MTTAAAGAARAAGMSRESAYRLRRRKGAESFAAAWDSIVAARPRGVTGFDLQWHRIVRAAIRADPGARWERTFRNPDEQALHPFPAAARGRPLRGRSQ
jgi:hypothetical protein